MKLRLEDSEGAHENGASVRTNTDFRGNEAPGKAEEEVDGGSFGGKASSGNKRHTKAIVSKEEETTGPFDQRESYVASANRLRLVIKIVVLLTVAALIVMHVHDLDVLQSVYFVIMTLTTGMSRIVFF